MFLQIFKEPGEIKKKSDKFVKELDGESILNFTIKYWNDHEVGSGKVLTGLNKEWKSTRDLTTSHL